MVLIKYILLKVPEYFKIQLFKRIIGILAGLFFSFAFYSFLYLIREVFRLLSVTWNYDLWILTDEEVHFYNLVFAYISVIIGQSVTLIFWFDSPKRLFEKQNRRRAEIINDQRFLNWYFLSWFSKLAIVFGIMFGLAFHCGFYVISIYPDYYYVFILIIIVLFLQSWTTIRKTFKRNSLKWMLWSFVLISILALVYSRINLTDYKAINQHYLKNNIFYSYNLELPETDCFELIEKRSLTERIYLVNQKGLKNEPLIIIDNEIIAIDKLDEKIIELQSSRDECEIPLLIYRLYIHKSIKMKYVNRLKEGLIRAGISRIAYAVIPINPVFDKRYYYHEISFNFKLPGLKLAFLKPSEVHNFIEIKQVKSVYYINDSLIPANQIKKKIKEGIQANSDYVINYKVNENVEFSDYIKVLFSIKKAINELRNEYAQKNYHEQFDLLNEDDANEVRDTIPFLLNEL